MSHKLVKKCETPKSIFKLFLESICRVSFCIKHAHRQAGRSALQNMNSDEIMFEFRLVRERFDESSGQSKLNLRTSVTIFGQTLLLVVS